MIFQIHTIKLFSEQDKEAGLKKLHSSLNNITKLWTKMSKLMEDVKDPALFQRAFSPGLQEFIEALCFLAMVESSELPSCDQVIIFFHTNFPCNLKETVPLGIDVIFNFLVALTQINLKLYEKYFRS